MTKKDYIKFAKMIAEQKFNVMTYGESMYADGFRACLDDIKNDLIAIFESDNPSFNVDKFNDYIDNLVQNMCK
jgi:hypothetical protein